MTGDVDMLIAPPPSCGDVDARQALHALCDCLRKKVRRGLAATKNSMAAHLNKARAYPDLQ